MKKYLLLHTCCGACLTYSLLKVIEDGYTPIIYYYNPNITPKREYMLRFKEIVKYLEAIGNRNTMVINAVYENRMWYKAIYKWRFDGEGSYRCSVCYRVRLQKTFSFAKKMGINNVSSTLTISPYRNSNTIFEIAKELEKDYGINYIYYNFKKKDGYKKSIELSKRYNIYRQDYCGCAYSKAERLAKLKQKEYRG